MITPQYYILKLNLCQIFNNKLPFPLCIKSLYGFSEERRPKENELVPVPTKGGKCTLNN